jgi:hypothetical protein
MASHTCMPRYWGTALAASLVAHGLLIPALVLLPAGAGPAPAEVTNTEVCDRLLTARLAMPELISPVLREPPPGTNMAVFEPRLDATPAENPGPSASPRSEPGAVASDHSAPSAAPGAAGALGAGATPALVVPSGARSVVFLLDRSASMGLRGAWDAARLVTQQAIERLPVTATFQVMPYNRQAEPLVLMGQRGLVKAGPEALEEATRALALFRPSGSTDHVGALRRGLALGPDALYLLSDAGDLTDREVAAITALNRRRTAIHTVEVTDRFRERGDSPLARLAAENGGTYRRLSPEGGLAAAP